MVLWAFLFFAFFSHHCVGFDCIFFCRLVGWDCDKSGKREGKIYIMRAWLVGGGWEGVHVACVRNIFTFLFFIKREDGRGTGGKLKSCIKKE